MTLETSWRPVWNWMMAKWSALLTKLSFVASDVVEFPDLAEVPHNIETQPFVPPPNDVSCESITPAPRRRAKAEHHDYDGTWHFRSTILDRLDEYFACIRRVQRHDPDSYALFSRIGFTVPPDWLRNPANVNNLERLKTTTRISFGGILMATDSEREKDGLYPSFVYFHKMKNPSAVQVTNTGDIYRLTCVYDDRHLNTQRWSARFTMLASCHVCLHHDGTVTLLKERVQCSSRIVSRRRNGHRDVFTLTNTQWGYPTWLKDVPLKAENNGMHRTAAEWICGMFVLAILTHADNVSRIIVRATQGGSVAAFGIDLTRAKYFFADRDSELAIDGRKKRIFHSVIEHTRHLDGDRQTTVRFHYRGLRHFDWNGYNVHIVLPSHNQIVKFPYPSYDAEDVPECERPDMIGSKDVGEALANVLQS